jgi:tetratricopeptide (TPR) repeat protein
MPSILSRALVAGILLLGMPARAQTVHSNDPSDEGALGTAARAAFVEGLKSFNIGEYDAAIERFKAAYRLSPAPGLLYNLAQAHRLKGDCSEALILYRRYLATEPPAGKMRQWAETRIADMETCVQASAGRSRAMPTPQPPPPTIAAVAPLPARELPAPVPRHGRAPGLVIGGAALGLGMTSAYFGWRAASEARQNSVENLHQPWDSQAARTESAGVLHQRLAVGSGIAALIVAGIATWVWRRD